jgi:hypothetical protein
MGLMQSVRSWLQRVWGEPAVQCTHLDQIRDVTPLTSGCQECLELGDSWVHLRMCMTDGEDAATPSKTSTPAGTLVSMRLTIRSCSRWSRVRTGCGATPTN